MKDRAYRIIERAGLFHVQFRFLGLFWRTHQRCASHEKAEEWRNNYEAVRWFLWGRRQHEKLCWAEIEAFAAGETKRSL